MNVFRRLPLFFRVWVLIGGLSVLLVGTTYAIAQQVLRQGANDPQVQLAEDAAAALTNGASVDSVVGTSHVDIGASLAPFIVVYDSTGSPLVSSGTLHGQMPRVPQGVLESVKRYGQDTLTWQPEPGVRIASVIVPYAPSNGSEQGGYILAGRSLREVEMREQQLLAISLLALLATLFATLIGSWLLFGGKSRAVSGPQT